MFNIGNNLVEKQKYLSGERTSADFIPYYLHCKDDTILLKDNSLIKVIKVSGFSFETADDDDIDIKKNARNNLLKGMASGNFALWFHTIRRREEAYPGGK